MAKRKPDPKASARMKGYYAARKAAGICTRGACGRKARKGGVICGKCIAKHNATTKEAKTRLYTKRRLAGICCNGLCGRKAKPGSPYCPACRRKRAALAAARAKA